MEIDLSANSLLSKGLGAYSITNEQFDELKKQCIFKKFLQNDSWISELTEDKDDNKFLIVFSTYVAVKYKINDIDNKETTIVLEYDNGTEIIEKEFDSEVLSKIGVRALLKYGIRYLEAYTDHLVKYLIHSDSQAPIKTAYSKLGWIVDKNGVLTFKGDIAYGSTIPMAYNGKLEIKPNGSLDVWKDMISENVLPYTPLTFVLCLGFASPLLQWLNQTHDFGSLVFSLSQVTSTGKTTAEMLAISVMASPTMNNATLVTFNGTDNSIADFISNCSAYTIGLDEVGMNNYSNFEKFLYRITSGRSKMRLDSYSKQRDVKKYDTIVIMTAEYGLINQNTQKGLKSRIYELKDPMTPSAIVADRIKKTVVENYAVATKPYIEFLIKRATEIENDYENEYNFLLSKCSSVKPLTRRILSKLAIVSLAGRYAVEAIGIKVDMQALREYILELEKNISNEPSPEEILLEAIQRDIIEYGSRYMFNETNKPEKGYGIIFSEYSTTEIYITETSFLRIMAKNNINNWKSTLSELKRKNILIAEKDRLTKRLKLFASMPKQKCYCFRLVDDNNDSTDTNQNPNDELTHLEDLSFDINDY